MPILKATTHRSNSNRGFTLVELLIVMLIIGLGFMSMSPNLASTTVMGNKTEDVFNTLIESHLKMAKELNRQVFIKGTIGSDTLNLADSKEETIPDSAVSRAKINGKSVTGSEFYIYFYPDGIFDEFELTLNTGKVLTGYPVTKNAVLK